MLARGDISDAETAARIALRRAEGASQNSVAIGAYLLLGIAALLDRDTAGLAEMRGGLFNHRRGGLLVQRSDREESDMAHARLSLLLGCPNEAHEWIRGWNTDAPATRHIHASPYAQVLYGKYLLSCAGSDAESARNVKNAKIWLDTAESALKTARSFRSVMSEIYCHILSAVALIIVADSDKSADSLDSALCLAMPDRLVLPFAEHYSEISRIFAGNARLARQTSRLKEIGALAKRLRDGREAHESAGIPFGLTEKEYKVACMAANRLRNREIGDMLGLTVGTVKQYLNTIYHKIGSRGRPSLENIFGKAATIRRELP
jgi:DNA-binding CsgD family transcriptional regulator